VLFRRIVSLVVFAGALGGIALGCLGVWFAPLDFFAQFTVHWAVLAAAGFLAVVFTRAALPLIAAALVLAVLAPASLSALYWGEADRPAVARAARLAELSTSPVAGSFAGLAAGATAGSSAASGPVRHAGVPARVIRPAGAPAFKFLTFNLLNTNRAVDDIIAEIARHDADVVFLAEFGPLHAAVCRWMADRYPYSIDCSTEWSCTVGLYSRFPLENGRTVDARADAGPRRLSADVKIAGTRVHVIGAHMISPIDGPSANFRELDFLARLAADERGPVVVAGDFNATIFSHALQNFREKSGLIHMGHLIASWPLRPVALPQIGIDHIFMSSDLELYDIAAGHPAGSDHLPIVATLRLAR
jgi:endonuclease/exonuclease/phosphatase (EEP) superfamily protein YafD